jgi:Flp pilus assembly protein CpaB
MSDPGPFKLKLKLPQPTSRFGMALKNVSMFLVALAVTAGLGTVLKSCISESGTNGEYYLEARETLRAGDVLSSGNVTWRSARGGSPAGAFLTSDRSGGAVFGQTLTRPVLVGKPVPANSFSQAGSGSIALEPGELAFVLSGAETEAVAGFVKVGDQVNVIAVLGAAGNSSYVAPNVGTVVESARVLAVREGASRRAGGGREATVAILLTQEEAEDLAAWRYAGRLVVALAGEFIGLDRDVEWRPLFEIESGVSPSLSSSDEEEVSIYSSDEEVASEPVAEEAPGIQIISPSGVQVRPVQ